MKSKKGFTLFELAIVLLIIGMVTAYIVAAIPEILKGVME